MVLLIVFPVHSSISHGLGAILIVYLLCTFPVAAVFRHWARTKAAMHHRMAHFKVEECSCCKEDDRQLVYRNIALLMRAIDVVGSQATDEDALDAFNELVRQRFPIAFAASVGRFGIGYLQAVSVFGCTYLPRWLDSMLDLDVSDLELWKWMLSCFTMVFAVFPLALAFGAWWSSFCLHLRGLREWAFMSCGCVMAFAFAAATYLFPMGFFFWHGSRVVGVAGMIVFVVTLTPPAIAAFNLQQFPWKRHREE
eukprot:CAMPEP_0172919772 /NCGR_PEP_ID=MMETSP1075-20121228/202764_1 /TAXON_ID=2916 /ORGANISM="Ceratium fusus, Strain PA161109" /LENGTH=251 /DNA_ID=CAMNT_0013779671 /DNA_START=50 /DNA_END=805 /DNA_ORIENTATION=+